MTCNMKRHRTYKSDKVNVMPPTRHRMSSEGSFFFSSSMNFKLVHSYNVKHLTCIIFCSSGLQNIYTRSIYGSVQHLQYLHWFTKFHIQNTICGDPFGATVIQTGSISSTQMGPRYQKSYDADLFFPNRHAHLSLYQVLSRQSMCILCSVYISYF